MKIRMLTLLLATLIAQSAGAQPDGMLHPNGRTLFPIGFYELPKDDVALREMAKAGVNLIVCHSREELDRLHAAGMMGVISLPLQNGPTGALREEVESMKDHPALAAWEGPDEIVWNFTAASMLYRVQHVHSQSGEWWKQTPDALRYAREQASRVIPAMREAVALIRDAGSAHPAWINEALQSDAVYVRQYMDFGDVTGCDIYPVKKNDRRIERMASAVERWKAVGQGKPVWMVLQAFSWNELGDYYGETETAYPSFDESRFMAYDVIAHGAGGVLYWGSQYTKSELFRQSLYALTSELNAIQPFLIEPDQPGLIVRSIEIVEDGPAPRGVLGCLKKSGDDWLLILVNEDNHWRMGVEAASPHGLDGRTFYELYGEDEETATFTNGALTTRMPPYGVKVFCTSRDYETSERSGREFNP
ncbi:MAG: hypothetical protein GC154_10245 [bacterium]|nr:hypothetical protein [bacterium]